MKFSERQGIKPVSETLQTDSMTIELRNSIWNVLDIILWKSRYFIHVDPDSSSVIQALGRALWFSHFKKPLDELPQEYPRRILEELRAIFFSSAWHEVYDLVESIINDFGRIEYYGKDNSVKEKLISNLNVILERELAGFKIVGDKFVPITDKEEVDLLEEALRDTEFPGPTAHLKRALDLLADRDNPDYRNSVKESISAVEAMAIIITNQPKATLGEALSAIEQSGKLHGALRQGFSSLYGYSSDEGGIRHAMLEEPNITAADAKYFLISCSAFVNYLKTKL